MNQPAPCGHRSCDLGRAGDAFFHSDQPMIRLTAQDVAEFRELYRRETGREITDDQAREYAERLIRFVAFAAGINLFPPPSE